LICAADETTAEVDSPDPVVVEVVTDWPVVLDVVVDSAGWFEVVDTDGDPDGLLQAARATAITAPPTTIAIRVLDMASPAYCAQRATTPETSDSQRMLVDQFRHNSEVVSSPRTSRSVNRLRAE
jgi:hypothetical protein